MYVRVCVCVGVCMCGFCNVWVCVCVGGCFGNMCTCIYWGLYCFVYLYSLLDVLSVPVYGLLPPSDNTIAVHNNNNK